MHPNTKTDIHLSIVATSRNDNHGGYLTQRMQHFVNGLVTQCKRHNLRAELVLVEWNPPADRKPLAEELAWPEDCGPCDIRIITVPREIHAQIPHADKLPLFQMIAKNVGIRRARGRFVLATNIDILFSNDVLGFMRDRLQEGRLYRTDRFDVPTDVPVSTDFEEVLKFCRENAFRIHAKGFTSRKENGRWYPRSSLHAVVVLIWKVGIPAVKRATINSLRLLMSVLSDVAKFPYFALRAMVFRLTTDLATRGKQEEAAPRDEQRTVLQKSFSETAETFHDLIDYILQKARGFARFMHWIQQTIRGQDLFTNACGDFTLLSAADWSALAGYPEWAMYSWHLDSILLYQANRSGIREIYLGKSAHIYHIEHEPGSGFTPESSEKLFERLLTRGIPYLDWRKDVERMVAKMEKDRRQGLPIRYNDSDWGYANHRFTEVRVDRRPSFPQASVSPDATLAKVSS